jgi:two-component SAPR family response regulator
MESYDTKIKCFGGLDFSQQQSFLFKPKSDELLSFFLKKKGK